jgi:hypothetical protein
MSGANRSDLGPCHLFWVHKGGITPASFQWELAMRDGMFERSMATGGRGTPGNLLEQIEVWAAEQRKAESRS